MGQFTKSLGLISIFNMKIVIAVSLCVMAALVYAEHCDHDDECMTVMCGGNGTMVMCEDHICTCTLDMHCMNKMECDSKGSCGGPAHGHHEEPHHGPHHGHEAGPAAEWHCLDGMCKCLDVHV